ncbi:hypothetical protein STRCI_001322 [Streptomyces cinnabarinus]|uniref:Uncharacterized protein n=1 Tax=Streptomyces cinnabarinus TaxID=67287 RepID=A0ABY7K6S7_9ACTN|nr:hypothetical protein [Streptomyces cinnabarinus]WAZ20221.1 hypothetical protein STRCI_001322 [Streptomyces cinnabarinus]
MAHLTPWQVFLVAVIGGFAAGLANTLLRLMWRGLDRLFEDFVTWRDACRTRRDHLRTCRAINALGTTNHPKE